MSSAWFHSTADDEPSFYISVHDILVIQDSLTFIFQVFSLNWFIECQTCALSRYHQWYLCKFPDSFVFLLFCCYACESWRARHLSFYLTYSLYYYLLFFPFIILSKYLKGQFYFPLVYKKHHACIFRLVLDFDRENNPLPLKCLCHATPAWRREVFVVYHSAVFSHPCSLDHSCQCLPNTSL